MKLLKKMFVGLTLVGSVLASNSFAGNCEGKVDQVYNNGSDLAFNLSCHNKNANNEVIWIGILETGEARNSILSMVLSAKASDNTVFVSWSDYASKDRWDTFESIYIK